MSIIPRNLLRMSDFIRRRHVVTHSIMHRDGNFIHRSMLEVVICWFFCHLLHTNGNYSVTGNFTKLLDFYLISHIFMSFIIHKKPFGRMRIQKVQIFIYWPVNAFWLHIPQYFAIHTNLSRNARNLLKIYVSITFSNDLSCAYLMPSIFTGNMNMAPAGTEMDF